MLKRVLLALTFVVAFGAAGVGMSAAAKAGHDCWYGGYGYGGYDPVMTYSYGGYGPRVSYYRDFGRPYPYYRQGHRGRHGHRGYHGHGNSVYFSIGF